ncbi:hypothetical protein SESBI_07587 [Sesbania bispinosa]|nr:hypothetical protein SESBI_07587 [Sesbania bispinosa]
MSSKKQKVGGTFSSKRTQQAPKGGKRKIPNDFNEGDFWYLLTGSSSYTPSSAKASHIQNPCFKYIHRVMAHSVFGRGESLGNVRVGKAVTGDIVIGGFITPLSHALNIDLSHDKQVLGQPSRSHEDLAEDAPSPSSFSAGLFDEQREQLQNIELRQQRLQDMIQAHHQWDIEYRAMLQAMYHWHISQGHFPPPQ